MFKRAIFMVLMAFSFVFGMAVLPAVPATAEHEGQGLEEHCPDHEGHPGKVQAGESPKTITVDGVPVTVTISGTNVVFTDSNGDPIVVEFCIKAADLAGGVEQGSSGSVDWVNHGGQTPAISYVVVYNVVDEREDPEEPEEPEAPVTPRDDEGDILGATTVAQAEQPQVETPKGAVGAGAGGATQSSSASLLGVVGSALTMAAGFVFNRRFEL